MIIGITGHQQLGPPATVAWARTALQHELKLYPRGTGLSNLAAGADQLFATVILELGWTLEAIIPCADYHLTFPTSRARGHYAALLGQARHIHVLAYPHPSEPAFLAAGRQLAERCDLLLALWDGEPARGSGGTADVVQYARALARPVVHLNPLTRSRTPLADP